MGICCLWTSGKSIPRRKPNPKKIVPMGRKDHKKFKSGSVGKFQANFKEGRGDYAGIAGALNDAGFVESFIYEYAPNDFGLYNMAGNVNEWVFDIYRPLNFSGHGRS